MVEVGKMNRIKFFLISFILLMQTSVFADFQLPIRDYNQTSQTVYLDTLGAISASGFKIIEMQSKNGLVYFSSQDIQYYAKVFNAGPRPSPCLFLRAVPRRGGAVHGAGADP